MKLAQIVWVLLISCGVAWGQRIPQKPDQNIILSIPDTSAYLNIPGRSERAIGATEFIKQVTDLSVEDREQAIVKEIISGNVPAFARKLKPVKVTETIDAKLYELIFFATADYLAIGSDTDYLYVPLTPFTAQYLANRLECMLPTKKMVDIIYANAATKLRPQPIPPSEKMTTIPIFWQHADSVKQQLAEIGFNRQTDEIIAGHKKDIIISNKIHDENRTSDKVVIYGWHKAENSPIQPVYAGHIASYADYSHGVRLISENAFLNGKAVKVQDILNDPNFAVLLSNEGVINKPFYPLK